MGPGAGPGAVCRSRSRGLCWAAGTSPEEPGAGGGGPGPGSARSAPLRPAAAPPAPARCRPVGMRDPAVAAAPGAGERRRRGGSRRGEWGPVPGTGGALPGSEPCPGGGGLHPLSGGRGENRAPEGMVGRREVPVPGGTQGIGVLGTGGSPVPHSLPCAATEPLLHAGCEPPPSG